jgi:hypothetical protein
MVAKEINNYYSSVAPGTQAPKTRWVWEETKP